MSDYRSNTTVEEIAERIRAARRILLTTHVKADGDGMGSALALHRALEALGGYRPEIFLMGPVESRLREVAGATPFRMVEEDPPDDDYDLAVLLDTGSWSQLKPLAGWLKRHRPDVVGVDHHAKGDEVAALRLVDPGAASTTELLVPLLETLGCPLTGGPESVAEAIFVGLATDTGWFRYSNATARTLDLAGRLLKAGVDKTRLYQIIEETFRPERLGLLARALASLEYHRGGAVAVMKLSAEDMAETGGLLEDLSELVNTPMVVKTVRVSILLAELAPGRTKLSLRSKPPATGRPGTTALDMNLLAQRFGGGGHVHAAGAQVAMRIPEACRAVIAALEELSETPNPALPRA